MKSPWNQHDTSRLNPRPHEWSLRHRRFAVMDMFFQFGSCAFVPGLLFRSRCHCWRLDGVFMAKSWENIDEDPLFWMLELYGLLVKKAGWWFGCHFLFSQKYWECHHPNWLSYFSEGWPNHQPEKHGKKPSIIVNQDLQVSCLIGVPRI